MRAKVNERLTNCLRRQEPRVVCVNTCDRRKQKPYGEKLNMKGTNYSISFETHKRAFWLSNNMLVWNTWSHAFPTLLPFKMSPDRIIWLHRFLFLFQVFNIDVWDYDPKRKLTVVKKKKKSSLIMFQIFFGNEQGEICSECYGCCFLYNEMNRDWGCQAPKWQKKPSIKVVQMYKALSWGEIVCSLTCLINLFPHFS